jgi:ABC-type sugar transport system permease subunit
VAEPHQPTLTERSRRFIAFHNCARLAHDTTFVGALKTTARYVGATIAVSMVLGIRLAVLL